MISAMSKGAFANEEVMEEYLNALLNEDSDVAVAPAQKRQIQPILKDEPRPFAPEAERVKPVEELLKQVEIPAEPVIEEPKVQAPTEVVKAPQELEQIPPQPPATPEKAIPVDDFQALYFEVAGLVLAVPLTELGGIHNIAEVSPLFGKPSWFKGLMIHREQKLNVVDSALWVMPEKYDENLAQSLDYKYLIMLGDSNWGLACEGLVNTVTMSPDDIKWRASDSKRPWLAGLVKEKMCALLDVNQLIQLLEQGLNSLDKK
ncbi:CheW protein [Catenovulum agarivorans DS-2]|uniref:CheW protein n=1 Tax=Catenovulum agarivorans DS-2 TaxID=1328313 RepID=W7Q9G2_9ALTE|nr:chemotaxis protein CheW [Catenovulum agarivorans]EWH09459.1 CheW protein [Catenovulum agarivorans DS-2]